MLNMRTNVLGFAETYGLDREVILASYVIEKETFTLERTAEEIAAEAAAANVDEYLPCSSYKGHDRLEAHPD